MDAEGGGQDAVDAGGDVDDVAVGGVGVVVGGTIWDEDGRRGVVGVAPADEFEGVEVG